MTALLDDAICSVEAHSDGEPVRMTRISEASGSARRADR